MDLRGVRALVIDDHEDSLDIEQELLTWAGAEVVVARSAAEVRRAWPDGGYDVIVGDITMPDRGACALVQRLRATGDRTPALALSSYGEAAERNALNAGFDRFLEKPVETDRLIDAVAELAHPPPPGRSGRRRGPAHRSARHP